MHPSDRGSIPLESTSGKCPGGLHPSKQTSDHSLPPNLERMPEGLHEKPSVAGSNPCPSHYYGEVAQLVEHRSKIDFLLLVAPLPWVNASWEYMVRLHVGPSGLTRRALCRSESNLSASLVTQPSRANAKRDYIPAPATSWLSRTPAQQAGRSWACLASSRRPSAAIVKRQDACLVSRKSGFNSQWWLHLPP